MQATASKLQTILVSSVTAARKREENLVRGLMADRSGAVIERRDAECKIFAEAAEQIGTLSINNKVTVWDSASGRAVPLADKLGDTSIVLETMDGSQRLVMVAEHNYMVPGASLNVAQSFLASTPSLTATNNVDAAVEAFVEKLGPYVVGVAVPELV
jgi:hypothetical protein